MWALGDLGPAIGLLLHRLEGRGLGGLVLHLDHVGRAGFGGRGEAAQRGERRRAIGVQAFRFELGLGQEHFPPVYLLLQVIVVGLVRGGVTVYVLSHGYSEGWRNDNST